MIIKTEKMITNIAKSDMHGLIKKIARLQGLSWRETWEKLSPKTVPLLPFSSSVIN